MRCEEEEDEESGAGFLLWYPNSVAADCIMQQKEEESDVSRCRRMTSINRPDLSSSSFTKTIDNVVQMLTFVTFDLKFISIQTWGLKFKLEPWKPYDLQPRSASK
ncbi:hypothetical protein JOB18_024548 [Solea senegalensis]|uniref:Uncharacterized protein n=1 Tax=Solea senegalensis TaxID=28829 RepID=A0AAV6QIF7_SOLSE|nr:hypothetical protein JOB18_024548 [Solea senegalensis]